MRKRQQCANCPAMIYPGGVTGLCRKCRYLVYPAPVLPDIAPGVNPCPTPASPEQRVAGDRELRKVRDELTRLKGDYKSALHTISTLEHEHDAMRALATGAETLHIEPRKGQRTSEGTVVALASDWHIEESVGGEVGGLNTYSLDIAEQRATRFFQSLLRLVQLLQQDIAIPHVILALLGDFITNAEMHNGDMAEACALPPTLALAKAQGMLLSGIDFLLANTEVDFTIVCHSGNHARTTQKVRFGAENGHSLEYLMYLTLAKVYRDNPRVTFIIPEGMHSYVDLYKNEPGATTIRFHHGHAVKYGGGVGGIYVPVAKAINQWNKARHADLDCFGHFHQMRDGGNFLCNGSLIGYNAFALSIKADFEKPRQALFLIDKKRGRTATWPILVGDK